MREAIDINKSILCGRFTNDPDIKYTQGGDKQTAIAKFSLAVDRKFKREGEPTADFINCIAFGKTAEFIEKYFSKGKKALACGRIQTGSYTNKNGDKVYTTDVIVEEIEFAESKAASAGQQAPQANAPAPPQFQQAPPQPQPQQNYGQPPMPPQGYAQPYPPQPQQYAAPPQPQGYYQPQQPDMGFMKIPDSIGSDELPFN